MKELFEKELRSLINKHSIDNDVNIPDFILFESIQKQIEFLNSMVDQLNDWNSKITYEGYPKEIGQIDTNSKEGKLLIAALSKISTESQTNKEPDQILNQVVVLADGIFSEHRELEKELL